MSLLLPRRRECPEFNRKSSPIPRGGWSERQAQIMTTAAEHPLAKYRRKRDFNRTTEPHGDDAAAPGGCTFVV